MKENTPIEDAKLAGLLRAARSAPSLPPRFQQNVWRRIETADEPDISASWLDLLATLVLRPKLAVATVAMLMLAGIMLGSIEGSKAVRQDAQARYIASVAPASLR